MNEITPIQLREGPIAERLYVHILQRELESKQDAPSTQIEDTLGVKCNFETECAWTWNASISDTFHVVTGANLSESNLTGMMPGPAADAKDDANGKRAARAAPAVRPQTIRFASKSLLGHFLHLRLTPTIANRTLKSPPFSTTKENCKLEVYVHQSGMTMGHLRIVIEPLNSYQSAASSSWVPVEYSGNDFRRWDRYTFAIGKVSQDFQILFEVVPKGLRGQQRGHVSIDNLSLRNCFPEGSARGGTCQQTDVRCQTNKVDVCIKTPQICDINVDCDEKEDEIRNCGELFASPLDAGE